jgi:hypothetical protein
MPIIAYDPAPPNSLIIVNEAGDKEKQSLIVRRDDFWARSGPKDESMEDSADNLSKAGWS